MSWLEEWDRTIKRAQESGRIAYMTKLERSKGPSGEVITAIVKARTRHPAFMGVVPPKVDPERDNG
jgi:hypothetical protein